MLARLSLRARLILAVIVLGAVGLCAADVATYSSLSSFLIDRTDSTLDQSHQQAVHSIEGDDFGGPRGGGLGLNEFVQLRTLGGAVVRTSANNRLPDGTTPRAPKLPASISLPQASSGGDRVRYFTVSAVTGGDRYRVRASIEANQPNAILIVATSLRDVDGTLHRLLWIELLVTGLVLAGLVVVGLWVVRLSLRPLDAIGATAAAIAGGELSRRIERADDRTEVGRLGLSLNAMLSQIESAFKAREASERKLRRFVADASHELRTPVTALLGNVEYAARHGADADVLGDLRHDAARLARLVDSLLALERAGAARPGGQDQAPVALHELARAVVDADESGRVTLARADPVMVRGDADALRRALLNLIENGLVHGPAGGRVTVAVARTGDRARVSVTDEGPGPDPAQRDRLFERFWRGEGAADRPGSGLGLSIVAAIAAQHGGEVVVEGSAFVLELPVGSTAHGPR